eukprot:Protomagalhaensia_sp_Gyna_25__4668@NODE_43_length_6376_cov_123_651570_g32_i0_p2_GENE_NODE_43_length_6376_cov_123_651570_g32_i0NODE_43_length_6376_cov_123_651570_g32_i0_p2_ORF_typecomplete_len406_score58_00GST_N/PF02798_20/1_9e07GST_N/PF02798_20/1_3e08GST_C_3/PF14497_6/0_0019GST_C_3/PF14497_6/2_3e11GST_N_3/PF13417_6/0_00038GST_N_3/PF13417_6/0_00062GST_C/PF00043_25/4_2GST_C/PF00043_25/0_0089GST_N_4/PF17172_4/0_35GST_N_4/PF17172_4/15GST_C_2/PF13410_6/2_3GST_C_2/PF13410_6/8_1Tom37/PF10568_9/1_5Tom37
MSQPKLTYFSFGGKAQPIRWCFHIYGIDYQDDLVSVEWARSHLQSKSPTGRLPTLEFEGNLYSDTLAILRLVAGLGNGSLLPNKEDDLHSVSVYCVADGISEILGAILLATTPEEKQNAESEALKQIPATLRALELTIGSKQDPWGHIASKRPTYVDLVVASQLLALVKLNVCTLDIGSLMALAPCCFDTVRMVLSIPAIEKFEPEFEMRHPVLTYFNLPGRAEAIRLCFALKRVPFEDKRLQSIEKDWWPIKDISPTGQLPMLEFDGKLHYVEAFALLLWVAERTGLAPATIWGRYKADAVFTLIQPVTRFWNRANHETDKKTAIKRAREEEIPPRLATIEKSIVTGTSWITGSKMTWIDIYVASQWKNMIQHNLIHETTSYPRFLEIHDAVYSLPEVKEYLTV